MEERKAERGGTLTDRHESSLLEHFHLTSGLGGAGDQGDLLAQIEAEDSRPQDPTKLHPRHRTDLTLSVRGAAADPSLRVLLHPRVHLK